MTAPAPRLVVVGIGADGWAGLPASHRDRIGAAEVLLGGRRHLASVPERPGQERRAWPSPLRAGLPGLLAEYADRDVVALASGDPLVSGIATTLLDFGVRVEVVPGVSSVALARARMGWPAEDAEVVSLVGRPVARLLRELAPSRRVLVLSADAATPGQVAALLREAGYGASAMTVLADLGAPTESRYDATAATWAHAVPALNVIALELAGPVVGGWTAGLPDALYEHDGQLTKRDLRAAALARLLPVPGQLLWDVGAGAGSVGIEWLRAHPSCRAVAVEAHPDRAARIARNASRLGVPDLRVVTGRAPEALAGLPVPDAVFVGGGASRPGVLDACRGALVPGGRLVVHGVTVETEAVLAGCYAEHGGELTRVSVEYAAPVGGFTGWTPARTVTQWAWTRP